MSKRQSRNIIIVTLCLAIAAVMGTFIYSNNSFKATGMSSKPMTNWKMELTDISVCTANDEINDKRCQALNGDAENVAEETFIDQENTLKATFTSKMNKYEDSITYKVVVSNNGLLPAKLTRVEFDKSVEDSLPIMFSYNNLVEGEIIKPNTSKTFYVMVSYIENKELDISKISNTINLTFVLAD